MVASAKARATNHLTFLSFLTVHASSMGWSGPRHVDAYKPIIVPAFHPVPGIPPADRVAKRCGTVPLMFRQKRNNILFLASRAKGSVNSNRGMKRLFENALGDVATSQEGALRIRCVVQYRKITALRGSRDENSAFRTRSCADRHRFYIDPSPNQHHPAGPAG